MWGWNFPLNNGGQEDGFNNPGMETFKGKPFESLAREIIQNSCDARRSVEEPVEVRFEMFTLPSDLLPGRDDLLRVFENSKQYLHDNEDAVEFFSYGVSLLNSALIPFLKISDYNTTGLTESNKSRGKWHALIKSVGVSNKGPDSGGSFGIGKHAPFVCSHLRTIFYSTKDEDGFEAFQGVAKLVTHLSEGGETTQGTGYFGITQGNQPLLDLSLLDDAFRRTEVGTDIFIAGFDGAKNWETGIIRSVLDNFFVAILQNRLIVTVGDVRIDTVTLPLLLETYMDAKKKYYGLNYYHALTSEDSLHVKESFQDIGELELYVLKRKDMHKKVAMVRSTGMKIFDKDRFQTHFNFAGVLLVNGLELNQFLRALEPPAHDKWEHVRHKEKTKANKLLRELYNWVKEQINSLSGAEKAEKLDVGGMSQFLPDDLDENPLFNQEVDGEGVKRFAKEFEIKPIIRKPLAQIGSAGSEVAAARDKKRGDETGDDGGNEKTAGINEPGQNKDKPSDKERGKQVPPVEAGGSETPKRKTGAQRISSVRSFCSDPDRGTYNVTYLPETSGQSFLEIQLVGEDGGESALIASAYLKETGESISINDNGTIGPVPNIKGQKNILVVTLKEAIRCSLGVTFK